MIKKIYTLYDSVSKVYMPPFVEISEATAKRAMHDACLDSSSMLCKHKADLSLVELADYDDSNGHIIPRTPINDLGLVRDLVLIDLADSGNLEMIKD